MPQVCIVVDGRSTGIPGYALALAIDGNEWIFRLGKGVIDLQLRVQAFRVLGNGPRRLLPSSG